MFNKVFRDGENLLSKRLGCNNCKCSEFDVVVRVFTMDLKCTKCGKEHSINIGRYEIKR